MRASVSTKPATNQYAAAASAALWGQELPLVRIVNPTVDLDPNTAAVSPADPRVVQWPTFGAMQGNLNMLVAILGGTSLSGRFWYYEPALSLWYASGNGFFPIAMVTGALQGQVGAAAHGSKPMYFQTMAVVGVTDLFYGLI